MAEVVHFDQTYCSPREGTVLDFDWALRTQRSCIRHGVADSHGKLAAPSSMMDLWTGGYTVTVRQTKDNVKNYLLAKCQSVVAAQTNQLKQLNDIVRVR